MISQGAQARAIHLDHASKDSRVSSRTPFQTSKGACAGVAQEVVDS